MSGLIALVRVGIGEMDRAHHLRQPLFPALCRLQQHPSDSETTTPETPLQRYCIGKARRTRKLHPIHGHSGLPIALPDRRYRPVAICVCLPTQQTRPPPGRHQPSAIPHSLAQRRIAYRVSIAHPRESACSAPQSPTEYALRPFATCPARQRSRAPDREDGCRVINGGARR